MNNENNLGLNALNDEELGNVSGGVEAGNLLFTGKAQKAGNTVQKGTPGKAGSLVFKETKKATAAAPAGTTDLDGILLSGGGDLKSC